MSNENSDKIKNFAPVIECFTKFIRYARDNYFDKAVDKKPIPPIVLTLKPQKASFGYCTTEPVFKNKDDEKPSYLEISYNEEKLDRPLEHIFVTLLHEMCHASNAANGIQDVAPKSQYHNNFFKISCDEIGLVTTKLNEKKQYGFLTTGEMVEGSAAKTLFENFCNANEEEVSCIKEILSSPIVTEKGEKKKRNKNLHRYQCPEQNDDGTKCSCKCRAKKNAKLMCGEHRVDLVDLDFNEEDDEEED